MKLGGLRQFTVLVACSLTFMALPVAGWAASAGQAPVAKQSASSGASEALLGLGSDKLKGLYLECDSASSKSLLGIDEAMYCSQVYEALLKKEFNNSFTDFMEWWRANKPS